MSRPNQFGMYQNRKVEILRPATAGDVGYDPSNKDDLVLIRYAEPLEGKDAEPEVLVKGAEVSPIKE